MDSKFDKLFNTIMEEAKASKIKAKKVIKEDVFNKDSDGYDAVFQIFEDCIQDGLDNSNYDLNNYDAHYYANENINDVLWDLDVREALQAYIADTKGETDAYFQLKDAMMYYVNEYIIPNIEKKQDNKHDDKTGEYEYVLK